MQRSRNLVFTSSGDRSNVVQWLAPRGDFDLWVAYYGDLDFPLKAQCQYFSARKGSKFQNLKAAFESDPSIFNAYDAIFVPDDDLEISDPDIESLFGLLEKYALTVLQPAFRSDGRISHPITTVNWKTRLRYSNFIEVGCPLFQSRALCEFLTIYDGTLTGWEIDWWFMEVLRTHSEFQAAIIDVAACRNPYEAEKQLVRREIDVLEPAESRRLSWSRKKTALGLTLEDEGPRVTGAIRASLAERCQTWGRYRLIPALRRRLARFRRLPVGPAN